jgi:hypothetical protein
VRIQLVLAAIAAVSVASCDSNNRYELSKVAAGNTVRLDKRTGEVAIIKGDHIESVKDSAKLEAERRARASKLEELKSWDAVDVPQIGARATLQTLWRDGRMFYQFRVFDLKDIKRFEAWFAQPKEKRGEMPQSDNKKIDENLRGALRHIPFTVTLNDTNGFNLSSFSIDVMSRVVNEDGTAQNFLRNDSMVMTEADYQRIVGWNVGWRR